MTYYTLVLAATAILFAGCSSGPAVTLDELILENWNRDLPHVRYVATFSTSKLSGIPSIQENCRVVEWLGEGDAESAGQQSRETRSERLGPAMSAEEHWYDGKLSGVTVIGYGESVPWTALTAAAQNYQPLAYVVKWYPKGGGYEVWQSSCQPGEQITFPAEDRITVIYQRHRPDGLILESKEFLAPQDWPGPERADLLEEQVQTTYLYNKQGDLETMTTQRTGKTLTMVQIEYLYDHRGNWVRKRAIHYGPVQLPSGKQGEGLEPDSETTQWRVILYD